MEEQEYLLGINEAELDRLQFQHKVWKPVTDAFLDRVGVHEGWRCLDVGGGPGFVACDLRERVGESGEVTVLEPSSLYLARFAGVAKARGWTNTRCLLGHAENTPLPESAFDMVFARWVLSFVRDAGKFLVSLVKSLRPGGILAVQDYFYEGLSLYPRGGAFERMPEIARDYYRSGGGDPFVAAHLPSLMRSHGLQVVDFTPHSLAGGPDSEIMEWAHRFFMTHTQRMVEAGIISQREGDEILADWLDHRSNPDAIFFAPIVVDVAARKPA